MMSIVDLDLKRQQLINRLAEKRKSTFLPPSRMPVDEWADTYRILPSETSAITGQWRTSAFEVARGPMRAATEPGVRQVTGMASAQIFKTSMIECVVGHRMQLAPCPILIYTAGDDSAKKLDSAKLEPMIRACPTLKKVFGGEKALDKQNPDFAQKKKRFPGGSYEVMTSESGPNWRMRTAGIVALDELSGMTHPPDGDPVTLGKDRCKNFQPNDLLITTSTPLVEGHCAISHEYSHSDQRKPFVPCPCCGEYDYFRWENFDRPFDDNGQPVIKAAAYVCSKCDHRWTNAERVIAVTTKGAISWRQCKTFHCCGETQDPEDTRKWLFVDDQTLEPRTGENTIGLAQCKHCNETPLDRTNAGFWGWELYNPLTSFEDLMRGWVGIKGNKSKTKAFHNNRLARTFRETVEAAAVVDPAHLSARAEPPWMHLPDKVKFITAGVDVQSAEDGRIELEVVGWTDDEESWSLDYQVFEGNPSEDDVWRALDEYLLQCWEREDGKSMPISAVCIDTGGHFAAQAANFCAPRQKRRIFAIKGANERKGTRLHYIFPAVVKTTRLGCPIHSISSNGAKDRLEQHLSKTDPGPGYMHIPANRDKKWYTQLLSEHRKFVELGGGRTGSYWDKRPGHVRNEAIDCRAYAIAAMEGLRVKGFISKRNAPGFAAPKPKVDEKGNDVPVVTKKKVRRSRTSSTHQAPSGW